MSGCVENVTKVRPSDVELYIFGVVTVGVVITVPVVTSLKIFVSGGLEDVKLPETDDISTEVGDATVSEVSVDASAGVIDVTLTKAAVDV